MMNNINIFILAFLLPLKVNADLHEKPSPLCAAAMINDYEKISLLIQNKKHDPNKLCNPDEGGFSPLHQAAMANSYESVEVLIHNGADVDIGFKEGERWKKDVVGSTPLHFAAQDSFSETSEIIRLLLENGADINAKDNGGQTALDYARSAKSRKASNSQIDHQKRIDLLMAFNSEERSPKNKFSNFEKVKYFYKLNSRDRKNIINAIEKDNEVELKKHLNLISPNSFIEKGKNSILHLAVEKGAFEIVKLLINNGAKVNIKNYKKKTTPLHAAVFEEHYHIIKYLIEKGADIDSGITEGNSTPLISSLIKISPYTTERFNITKLLIENNANIKHPDDFYGKLPIHFAVEKNSLQLVNLLITKGANTNARDKNGYTPVFYIKSDKILKLLLKSGADINRKNNFGYTALHEAAKHDNRFNRLRALIENNAYLNEFSDDKKTAAWIAEKNGALRNLELLRENGVSSIGIALGKGMPGLNSGKEVFDSICYVCHTIGILSAPRIKNKPDWEKRSKKGITALLNSAVKGKGNMPPRGGNPELSDKQLKSAIIYMLETTRISLD